MNVADIGSLISTLADRAANAAIGRSRIVNDVLRETLRDLVRQPAGSPGSFLAEPLAEAVFGWKTTDLTMQQLAEQGLLSADLVNALDRADPIDHTEERERNCFPRDRHPYLHQLHAWQALKSEKPRSLVVTSGTGSGKTECFLVPILDDLARQRSIQGRLVGVQALFLYPLNALIASQRDRLSDWTEPFGGDLRYCLFNGKTPEQVPSDRARETPWEVRDRRGLRAAPPPILVTNATMLEYMLIRSADRPILGQGRLRWIVLDEAHTYTGSQAAEMTLLLRRTMHAFGVEPSNVRFIATSATLGSDESSRERLRKFIADVSGRTTEDVDIVDGRRDVPILDPGSFDGLADYPAARALRERLAEEPATLRALASICPGEDVTNLLVNCIQAKDTEGGSFLPVRLHLFHRPQPGVWACINPSCLGRLNTRLQDSSWPFGSLLVRDAPRCPACECMTLQVLQCDECGAPFLEAARDRAQTRLSRWRDPSPLDEFAAEAIEPDDTEEDSAADADSRVLLTAPGLHGGAGMFIDGQSGDIPEPPRENLIRLDRHEPVVGCPCCGAGNAQRRHLFRPLRLGGPFMTGVAADVLLDAAPPAGKEAALKPHGGRQMITFTDSRQGTARFAASWQREAERTYARSVLFHALQADDAKIGDLARKLDNEIAKLRATIADNPSAVGFLGEMLADRERERAALPASRLSWPDARDLLASRNEQQHGLRTLWKDRDPDFAHNDRLAQFQLFAEFLRRPTRGNNLETMGLIGLRFEKVEVPSDPPELLTERGAGESDWRDFLSICVTHMLRARRATFVSDGLREWVGQRARPRAFVAPDYADVLRGTDFRWPKVTGSESPKSRLVRLLVNALGLDLHDPGTRQQLNDALAEAFRRLRSMVGLPSAVDGRLQLDLQRAHLVRLDTAWVCPVTTRLLDCCFLGVTPYLPPETQGRAVRCEPVTMPRLPFPWLCDAEGDDRRAETAIWLRDDPVVEARRRQGVWTDLHDRLVQLPPFIRVAEHSAQQPSWRLERYERDFKAGKINALACSTTMEMGVDIGGITTVAMTNVPPSPTNYRQRVGRAGRRGEALAVAFTYCADDPLGWTVFDRPATPLERAIFPPHVGLDSRSIVQRHVNAFLLASFLRTPEFAPPQDKTRLQAVWFFGAEDDPDPPWRSFALWLGRNREQSTVLSALAMIVSGTSLADMPDLSDICAASIERLAMDWLQERRTLATDLNSATGAAQRAIRLQVRRLENEFLLKDLTNSGFLPGHGFPTGIVPFVAISPSELADAEHSSRDEGGGRAREFPSRGIEMAVREYAPGADVVLDGLVYRSAGISLNWQRPASENAVQEIQSIKWFWRCRCGAAGSALRRPDQCIACGQSKLSRERVLIPAGFSSDINEKPTGDVEQYSFVPIVEPVVSASDAEWVALENPEAGRMRASANGIIIGVSRGPHGTGYAICMACGRAEPESGVAIPLGPHRPLRAGRTTMRCDAAADSFTIQRELRLGYHRTTDVCEFQLAGVTEPGTATTVIVALREALTRQIGIERDEVGWAVEQRQGREGVQTWSMFLFDTAAGGAGYAASATVNVPDLVAEACKVLECHNPHCDSACPSCLIVRDTVRDAEMLDRKAGYSALNSLRQILVLPANAKVFTTEQRMAAQPLVPALDEALSRPGADHLLFHLPGDATNWDLASWWAAPVIERHARLGRKITLVAREQALNELTVDAAIALLALVVRGNGRVSVISISEVLAPPTLVAAVRSSHQTIAWAAMPETNDWIGSTPPSAVVVSHEWRWPRLSTVFDPAQALSKAKPMLTRINVHQELDGGMRSFGDRFWRVLGDRSPLARQWLGPSIVIAEVEYEDRYLFSPLTVGLLAATLKALPLPRGVKIPIRVRTQDTRQGGGASTFPYALHHDWVDSGTRNEVLRGVLTGNALSVDIRTAARSELPHARVMRLIAVDDQRLEIMLDQGFGYWRTQRGPAFDFNRFPAAQAAALIIRDDRILGSTDNATSIIVESIGNS